MKIAIIGGGVTSLAAGIFLRDSFPKASIELYTDVIRDTMGGHLSSWNENGYSVEHGFHALFGFYDQALQLVERVGALDNFEKSPEHVFVYHNKRIRKFDTNRVLSFNGFTLRERVALSRFFVEMLKLGASTRFHGMEYYKKYDHIDFKSWAVRAGVPKSIAASTFFDQFYAAAFNDPHEMSAFVALQSLHGCIQKPWHYYFKKPSRQALILPLADYFTKQCKGKIFFDHKLLSVKSGSNVENVESVTVRNIRKEKEVKADYYIVATGLEDFKKIRFEPKILDLPYFKNIQRLRGVSSLSIQAWFKEDPVPKEVDTFIGSLPKPFVVVCPISKASKSRAHGKKQYPHELIACGSEEGFENIKDSELIHNFISDLKKAGFQFKGDVRHGKDAYYKLRRNNDSAHRYLLTLPGQFELRPEAQSPLANLLLAGAWTKNDWALPCVEGCVSSARKAAQVILEKEDLKTRRNLQKTRQCYEIGSLVFPPPYSFPKSKGVFFRIKKKENYDLNLPLGLKLVEKTRNELLLSIFRHENVLCKYDPTQTKYYYNEVMLSVFVKDQKQRHGLFPICLFLDDDTAVAAGREVYGFPKKLAQVQFDSKSIAIFRNEELIKGTWRSTPLKSKVPPIALDQIFGLPIFNFHPVLQRVVETKMNNFKVESVSIVRNGKFETYGSKQDPLGDLIRNKIGKFESAVGIEASFSFRMD
ncbi:MAG: FAD-dependent oxidoreductase [Bacteriovoracia bacterium]